MSTVTTHMEHSPLKVHFGPILRHVNDKAFFDFCQANPKLRIERTCEGDLIIMSPTGGNTGHRNSLLNYMVMTWAEAEGSGLVFDSSTGFTLPNGAMRAPDLSWIRKERWDALSDDDRDAFVPICPDFVVELRSPSDTLSSLQEKMQEYIDNGAQLGWLIDPQEKTVSIYRPNQEVHMLHHPETISGDPLLSNFTLNLQKLWA